MTDCLGIPLRFDSTRRATDTRLIVPHTDFLSKSFENWSKEDEKVRRIVKVPVDYRIDVDRVRRKVEELVEGDVRSTGEPPTVEMVELDSETAVLWIWLSGTTTYTSWSRASPHKGNVTSAFSPSGA